MKGHHMMDHLAIAHLLEQIRSTKDQRTAAAEDAFYRRVGHSRLERLATRLLSMRATKRGRSSCDPSTFSGAGCRSGSAPDASVRRDWSSVDPELLN
jgi:hypothetical protein